MKMNDCLGTSNQLELNIPKNAKYSQAPCPRSGAYLNLFMISFKSYCVASNLKNWVQFYHRDCVLQLPIIYITREAQLCMLLASQLAHQLATLCTHTVPTSTFSYILNCQYWIQLGMHLLCQNNFENNGQAVKRIENYSGMIGCFN